MESTIIYKHFGGIIMKRSKDLMWNAPVIILVVLFVVFMCNRFSIKDEQNELLDKLKEEKADYVEDIYTTELNYQLNKLATDLDLFVYTMKSTDHYIFAEEDLKDFELYSDLVIYGDESYKKANDLEYKLDTVSMMVGVMNYHMDDINTFIYSLGKNRSIYEFLWENVYIDIEKVNKAISDYKSNTGYDLSKINAMKKITLDTINAGKSKWESIDGTVYPQGSLE